MGQIDTSKPGEVVLPSGRIVRPMTGEEFLKSLEDNGLIGMWADRTDIGDSTEYSRKLRRLTEERNSET